MRAPTLFLSREDAEGHEFTDDYLRDIVVNMTIAGRDTTAYALAWAMWLLATHPEAQALARAEAQAAFAKVPEGGGADDVEHFFGGLSYDAIDHLSYIDAVFTETLRLYPSVPKNPKCVLHDDTLPDGTRVKAGDYVMYIPYVMARLPSLWGPDCEAFDPSRHLKGRPRPSPYLWPAFQAGPRICLGQKLAYMEAKAVLAILLAHYAVAPVPLAELHNINTPTTQEQEEASATPVVASPPRPTTTTATTDNGTTDSPAYSHGHTSDEEDDEEEDEGDDVVLVNKGNSSSKDVGGEVYYTPRLVQNALTTPMEGEGCLLRVSRLPGTWREEAAAAAAAGGASTRAQ